MESTLFDTIRAACKTVAERATQVVIAHDRLQAYAASLTRERTTPAEIDASRHFVGRGDQTVAFFVTLDAINFGSGYFPHLRKRPGMSGYFTVASSLNDYFHAHGPLPAEELARLTAEDCTRIFGQEPENEPVQELMQFFATALNDLGRFLLERFHGSFVALVEAADHSAAMLVRQLGEMSFFQDVTVYHGKVVPFYKRAQLTAADLSLAFQGQGPGRFDDLDQLTIFADNLVPHVLRVDQVLCYDRSLAGRIDAGELIPAGAPEEIELRACAVHAVELLVHHLQESGQRVTAMQLDNLLWSRGQRPEYKNACPRHRTRTVYY